MKKIIFITLTVFILVGFASYERKPIYHTIANKTLEKLIYEFIENHKGQTVDKKCPYIKVSPSMVAYETSPPSAKTRDVYSIQHITEKDIVRLVNRHPLIMCNPINGKKIVFVMYDHDKFIQHDFNLIGDYIDDKESDAYKLFEEFLGNREYARKHNEENPGEEMFFDDEYVNFSRRELIVNFNAYGELIDTSYYRYEYID